MYHARIEHKGEVVSTVSLETRDPVEASKAAKRMQEIRRKQGLDGIVVPFWRAA